MDETEVVRKPGTDNDLLAATASTVVRNEGNDDSKSWQRNHWAGTGTYSLGTDSKDVSNLGEHGDLDGLSGDPRAME
jgi:hypothetical protein